MKNRPSTAGNGRSSYMDLVGRFPLRPLRAEADYDAAVEVLDALAGRDDLNPGEVDYLEALTRFVEDYDDAHHPFAARGTGPVQILKYLLAEHDMSRADLGRVLGSASAASMVLNGQRDLSRARMAKLAAYFKVDAGLFVSTKSSRALKRPPAPRR